MRVHTSMELTSLYARECDRCGLIHPTDDARAACFVWRTHVDAGTPDQITGALWKRLEREQRG